MPREFPAVFDRRLRALFPDYVRGRFNEQVGRWELVFLAASGREVSQFWGWDRNPLTGEALKPDPATGLYPYRDLDPTAQDEIVANCERTFLGAQEFATGDIRHDRRAQSAAARTYNTQLARRKRRDAAQAWADMLSEFDIRRPGWLKEHSPEHRRLEARRRRDPSLLVS